MKKFLMLLLLILLLAFLLSACSSDNKPINSVEDMDTTQTVKLTIPYEYLYIGEQDIDEYITHLKAEENIYSVKKDDDVLIINLSEEKLEEFKTNFINDLKTYIDYILNGNLSSVIINISYNQNIDEYLISINLNDLTQELEDLALELIKKSGLYQTFLLKDPKNTSVVVNFLNSESNTVISKINSLEYLNTFTDEHEH